MKKIFYKLFALIVVLSFTACGSDGNSLDIGSGETGKSDNISKSIKDNTSASVVYNNYGWEISLYTSLSSALPNKNIKYGLMCGYNGDDVYFQKYYNFLGSAYNTKEAVFIDGSDFYEDFHNYRGLMELQEKTYLTESEKDYINEVIYFFKSSEPKAKSKYWGQLFAEIDGKKYIIKEFGNKFQNNSGGGNSGGGNSGGSSSSSYEKPDIGLYDYTAYKTSLKVQYKIYNKDDAKVHSAKVYYGTTSNPSKVATASISGTIITANISGLKAGTIYYVKCVATGKGGTSTTSVTKCITNYDY